MRYEVKTSLTPEEVIERAVVYFGPGGAGLDVTSQNAQGVVLQGGGGYVAIQAQAGADTTVDIETREWDYPAQQFMARISRRRRWWSNWWRSKRRVSEPKRAPQQSIFTILNNQEMDANGDRP